MLNVSPLLINMICGFIMANAYPRPRELTYMEDVELPIYVTFFFWRERACTSKCLPITGSGPWCTLLPGGSPRWGGFSWCPVLESIGGGAKVPGFCHVSKAGVTIGLLLLVQGRFPELAVVITAVELAAVTVCEIIGPMGTRYALISSGETQHGHIGSKIKETPQS
jgi:hypothetical protein